MLNADSLHSASCTRLVTVNTAAYATWHLPYHLVSVGDVSGLGTGIVSRRFAHAAFFQVE